MGTDLGREAAPTGAASRPDLRGHRPARRPHGVLRRRQRIFATPIVNPCVLDDGIAELELVVDRGARAVLLRRCSA
jgi:hypothetical protein